MKPLPAEPLRPQLNLSLNDAYNLFISSRQARHKSKRTVEYYQYNLQRFKSYCSILKISSVQEISARVINGFIVEMKERGSIQGLKTSSDEEYFNETNEKQHKKLSPSYVHSYARVIKTFMHYLFEQEYIDRIPKFEMPIIGNLNRPFFTNEGIKKLLLGFTCKNYRQDSFVTKRNKVIIFFAIDSGLRLQEISSLNWTDIDLSNGQVGVIGKGDKFRIVGIGYEMMQVLQKYKIESRTFQTQIQAPPCNALFLNEDGYRLMPRAIDSALKRLSQNTGMEVSCHMLRRTCARNLLLLDKDLVFIQNQLGHVSIEMTRKYLQGLTPEILVREIQRGGSAADDIIQHETKHRRKAKKNVENPVHNYQETKTSRI